MLISKIFNAKWVKKYFDFFFFNIELKWGFNRRMLLIKIIYKFF